MGAPSCAARGGRRCPRACLLPGTSYLEDAAERGLHQQRGFATVDRYADFRLSMQRSTARDYVAIGRSLEELGAIDQGFREGRLSWSQVRLLVRIATEQTEACLVEVPSTTRTSR